MKKILIFSLAYYPYVGGAEVAVKEITDRISDIEFHMLTLQLGNEAKEERVGNILVHRIGFGGAYISKILFVPLAALAARRLHHELRFDAFWAMMTYMLLPIVVARMLGLKVPYALTLQDGDPFERVFERWHIRIVIPYLRYGFRNATVVSALSTYLAAWPQRMGYQKTVEIIPNGADTKHFAEAMPMDFGRTPGETWLVTSSRLVHKNAVDDVIRALAHLPRSIKFLVLGVGPDEKCLRLLAKTEKVEERVFFKGYVSHVELPGYLHASDIFIRPSRTEGFGASFPEAMAAGLPIIATQEGGIADFLFDAKRNPTQLTTGWAVDKDSPKQIACAVKDILANPEVVQQVIKNAREMVVQKYDWNSVVYDMREKVFARVFKTS
jgi:glycosyltransferase involved in cell wall biosynthesis